MPVVRQLPHSDATNGWSRVLPARQSKPSLDRDIKADWVVVGAGFAGLAAARRLADNRPAEAIALVDAGVAGENASGRNSGFGIDLPHNVGSSLEELEGSRRFMQLARAALDQLEGLVKRHAIDCQWSRAGKYHTAVSERGVKETLEPFGRELDKLGEPWRFLDKAALQGEIGTGYHTAAIHTPGCVLLNPAALCRGLAKSLPANVRHFENSPVTSWENANGVRLTTANGSVSAPRMIVCVNGLGGEFDVFKGRLLRFAAHASLSRRLDADEQRALGGNSEWGVTPANAFVSSTLRRTQDQRLMIRHQLVYDPGHRRGTGDMSSIIARQESEFRARFPMLPKVTLEHTWTGYVCLSRNHAPGFGQIASNVWAAVCQNAVGVTKGTIGGLLAADMACGIANPLISDMQSLGTPSELPPQPFLDVGVTLRNNFDLWRYRYER